jgi:hypothetical protein
MRWTVVAILVASIGVACTVKVNDREIEWIREAASNDLECPKGDLIVHHDLSDSDTKQAEGCGKMATYVRKCDSERCWWERSGEIGVAPPDEAAK